MKMIYQSVRQNGSEYESFNIFEKDDKIIKESKNPRYEYLIHKKAFDVGVRVPKLLSVPSVNSNNLEMEKINIKRNAKNLNIKDYKKIKQMVRTLHKNGVAHGDLHYSNIVLNEEDEWVFLDFERGALENIHCNYIKKQQNDILQLRKMSKEIAQER